MTAFGEVSTEADFLDAEKRLLAEARGAITQGQGTGLYYMLADGGKIVANDSTAEIPNSLPRVPNTFLIPNLGADPVGWERRLRLEFEVGANGINPGAGAVNISCQIRTTLPGGVGGGMKVAALGGSICTASVIPPSGNGQWVNVSQTADYLASGSNYGFFIENHGFSLNSLCALILSARLYAIYIPG